MGKYVNESWDGDRQERGRARGWNVVQQRHEVYVIAAVAGIIRR